MFYIGRVSGDHVDRSTKAIENVGAKIMDFGVSQDPSIHDVL